MNMRHTRLISAAVGALFAAGSLAGCSSSDVKSAAASKANDLKAAAASQAASAAQSAAAGLSDETKQKGMQAAKDLLAKLDPATQQKLRAGLDATGVDADLGTFTNDPAATLGEEFLGARQAALGTGDLSDLKAIATPKMVKRSKRYVKRNSRRAGTPYVIKVVGQDGTGTQVCVGPKGKRAKTVVVNAQGRVAALRKGTHTC